jgi:lipopolysaccharide/colanic/teichoic acid biosynthesis glycosyltransferase
MRFDRPRRDQFLAAVIWISAAFSFPSSFGTTMTILPSDFRHLLSRTPSSLSGSEITLELAPIVPARAAQSKIKRSMDFVGALVGLIFLAPIMAIVALLIRFESKGPALFRQKRVGLGGRIFLCLKFRTMVPDAEERLRDLEAHNESSGGVLFKIKNDPRVTPLGRLLRRTSLDELPQLWNVLRGQMSLIGPRPLQMRDSERLEDLGAEAYMRRLSVRPGLSGPWQVAGRSDLDSSRMVGLDLNYVENWSVVTDLHILFKTIVVVFSCRGAC